MKSIVIKNLLFELIHSLSKSEKKCFRLHAKYDGSSRDKNYLRLFDIILDQRENDEVAIKRQLLEHGTKINFNFTKSYLKSAVIESLVRMYPSSTVDSHLGQIISAVKILRKKMFYAQSNMLLKRGEKLSIETEQFNRLQEIYSLQSAGLTTREDIDILERKIVVSRKSDNLTAYHILSAKATLFGSRKDVSRSKSEIDALKRILDDSGIMKNEKMALSMNAKIIFHHINAIFHYFSGEHKVALKDLCKRLKYQEALPFYIRDMPMAYKVCLVNIIATNMILKDYDNANIYLNKLREFPLKYKVSLSEPAGINILYDQYSYQLSIYINTGQVNEMVKLLSDIGNKIEVLKKSISDIEKITLYYHIAYAYFICGNFIVSREWSERIKVETELSKREDVHSMIRILNIINHYELGHVELINYLERSARRFIKQKNRMFKTETVMLRFFRKDLPEINDKGEVVSVFKELKGTLKELFKDPFEAKITEYFDFISWVDSKIENRSFDEVKREKILKKRR